MIDRNLPYRFLRGQPLKGRGVKGDNEVYYVSAGELGYFMTQYNLSIDTVNQHIFSTLEISSRKLRYGSSI